MSSREPVERAFARDKQLVNLCDGYEPLLVSDAMAYAKHFLQDGISLKDDRVVMYHWVNRHFTNHAF
jgi:hypothetical protein